MVTRLTCLGAIGLALLSLLLWEQPHPEDDCYSEQAVVANGQRVPGVGQPISSDLLDLNAAGPSQLESLPGVGPVLAHRILEYRTKNPPFRRVEELLIIRGISRRKFEALRGRIRVGARTVQPPRPVSREACR